MIGLTLQSLQTLMTLHCVADMTQLTVETFCVDMTGLKIALYACRYYGLQPDIKVIAPWREWDLNSRSKLISYAEKNNIPVPASKRGEPPFSMDANLLHISYEGYASLQAGCLLHVFYEGQASLQQQCDLLLLPPICHLLGVCCTPHPPVLASQDD